MKAVEDRLSYKNMTKAQLVEALKSKEPVAPPPEDLLGRCMLSAHYWITVLWRDIQAGNRRQIEVDMEQYKAWIETVVRLINGIDLKGGG